MINTTDKPILLITGDRLDYSIRESLTWAANLMADQWSGTNIPRYRREAFSKFLGDQNRKSKPFDELFVFAAFEFASSGTTSKGTQSSMARMSEFTLKRTVAATNYAEVKRGLRLSLIELWRRRALLLPSVFTTRPNFSMNAFDHELLRWLRSFDPTSAEGARKTSYRCMYFYGPRLVLTTDWSRVEDVCLDEITELHLAQLRYAKGLHAYAIAGSHLPWTQLPAELLKRFPDRVQFSQADLASHSAWSARQAINRADLEEFSDGEKEPSRERCARTAPQPTPTHCQLTADANQAATHEAVLAYFKRLSRRPDNVDWRIAVPSYPGREYVDLGTISAKWIETFNAHLHHRKHIQGYRTSHEALASLTILADYLFAYLPWWRELYPSGAVTVPSAPRAFARYAFVSRHTEEPIDVLPAPLLQLVALRRPKLESRAICIKHLALYFRFVAAHYGDDEVIAGSRFSNPVDDEFDAPRIPGKKNKTNKEIIPRNIYGHLLFYCYAVEEFGQHLLQRALEGNLGSTHALARAQRFDCEAFDFRPVVKYRGSEICLHSVPNIFNWAKREVLRNGVKMELTVPHLTALRLLIVSLETGLRCQSVQWLDFRTWDSLNAGAGDQYTYRLLVNTDKTKVDSWAPPVVFRVRNILKREAAFQQLFVDFDSFDPVPYEGLDSSPFGPIRPLFRAPSSGNPVADQIYSRIWVSLLVDFEGFYKQVTGERHVRLYYMRGIRTPDGQPVVKYTGVGDAHAYCPISVLAVHTPHSCRATFATNRQGQGILELSDVAELLGHEGIATTAHYTKFSAEQLEERLQRSDAALLGDYSIFDVGGDSGYVRPDKLDSALVQSFSKDRDATVTAFRFMPPMALWSIEDESLQQHDGMTLLRTGPMSHIQFKETHICPVGEECPADILKHIGAPKRCGMCPLAMKCIDHLPAIAAKRNQLVERIRFLQSKRHQMETAQEPAASLDTVWDEIQLDINELLGWKFSEEVLGSMHAQAQQNTDATPRFHVERPDIVRRHLRLVTRQCDRTEFLLQRLAESSAYPSMTSPQVQMAAALLRRRFSAGQGLDDLAGLSGENDDVRAAAAMIGTLMKASGLTMKEVAALLTSAAQPPVAKALLLQSRDADGK
jgi:hypothetical protein